MCRLERTNERTPSSLPFLPFSLGSIRLLLLVAFGGGKLQDSFLTGGPSYHRRALTEAGKGEGATFTMKSIWHFRLFSIPPKKAISVPPDLTSPFVLANVILSKCELRRFAFSARLLFHLTLPPPAFCLRGVEVKGPPPFSFLAPCSCGFRLPEKMFVQKEKMPRK